MAPYPNLEIFMTQFDEDSARSEYQRSPGLQAEFGDEATYMAYQRGTAAGRIRPPITGRTVTAEAQPRREVDQQTIPPVRGFSSAAPRRQRKALESRDAAKRQAVAPDLLGIWQAHGPQAGRVQGAASMSRFKSFEEFQAHVNSHSPEVATHGR